MTKKEKFHYKYAPLCLRFTGGHLTTNSVKPPVVRVRTAGWVALTAILTASHSPRPVRHSSAALFAVAIIFVHFFSPPLLYVPCVSFFPSPVTSVILKGEVCVILSPSNGHRGFGASVLACFPHRAVNVVY